MFYLLANLYKFIENKVIKAFLTLRADYEDKPKCT